MATGVPEGSVALVTGGGGGVGQAVGHALKAAGHVPVLLGRTAETVSRAAAAVGLPCRPLVGDVTDRASIEAALATLTEEIDPPLVLVNAAGIAASSRLLPPDDALWARTLAVNATGPWIAATACLPAMREAGAGFIANVASTAALRGYRYTAAYVASKHALLGLTRALAADLAGSDVRVHAICPGFLDTPMTDHTIANMVAETGMAEDAARATLAGMNASGRLIRPEEVADAILALLADPTKHAEVVVLD